MSDHDSPIPIKTETPGDIQVKIVDATTTSHQLVIDVAGRVTTKLNDGTGNALASSTTTPTGTEQALIVRTISSGTQAVTGTVTANIGTTNGLALDITVDTLLKPTSTLAAVTTLGSITNTVVIKADTLANQPNALKVDGSATTQPVSIASPVAVTGPLTNTELRATVVAVSDGLGSTGVNGNLSLNTANTAYEAKVSTTRLSGRKSVSIQAIDGDMYWGYNNGVTSSNGTPLVKGQSISFDCDPNSTFQVWLVAILATKNARIAEST